MTSDGESIKTLTSFANVYFVKLFGKFIKLLVAFNFLHSLPVTLQTAPNDASISITHPKREESIRHSHEWCLSPHLMKIID